MRSVFSFWCVCSADCRSIRLDAVVAHLNDGNRIATLYNGQFTLSTQLIVLNFPVILSHRRRITVSLETYPLLFCLSVVTIQNTLFPEESLSQKSEKSVYRINWGSSTEKKCSSRYLDYHNRHLSLACSSARLKRLRYLNGSPGYQYFSGRVLWQPAATILFNFPFSFFCSSCWFLNLISLFIWYLLYLWAEFH